MFDTVDAEVEPFLGMLPPRSLLGFVRPADWGVHADRLFGEGVATSPVLAPRDAATSLPVVREEAATSPALVSPALAWLADFRSPDPCSSSDEEAQGRRRWKGLTQPPATEERTGRWADAEEADTQVEFRQEPPAAKKREPPTVATCLVPETQDEVDHAKEWWPEVASRFFCQKYGFKS